MWVSTYKIGTNQSRWWIYIMSLKWRTIKCAMVPNIIIYINLCVFACYSRGRLNELPPPDARFQDFSTREKSSENMVAWNCGGFSTFVGSLGLIISRRPSSWIRIEHLCRTWRIHGESLSAVMHHSKDIAVVKGYSVLVAPRVGRGRYEIPCPTPRHHRSYTALDPHLSDNLEGNHKIRQNNRGLSFVVFMWCLTINLSRVKV